MRYLLFTFSLLLAFSLPAQEAQIEWMSFEEALAQSKLDLKKAGVKPKKVLVDVYTDWCGWCKKMDRNTYARARIADLVNAYFYPVKLNAEQKQPIQFDGKTFKYRQEGGRGHHELAVGLLQGKMSFPTTVFLDENFNMIQPLPGYFKPLEFEAVLRFLGEEHYQDITWQDYQKIFSEKYINKY